MNLLVEIFMQDSYEVRIRKMIQYTQLLYAFFHVKNDK